VFPAAILLLGPALDESCAAVKFSSFNETA
jgi:hypothetical protein